VSSIREEKLYNPRLGGGKSEEQFVQIMGALNLAYPRRIDEALPVNMVSGQTLDEDLEDSLTEERVVEWPVTRTPTGAPNVVSLWVAEMPESIRLVDVRGRDEWMGPDGRLAGAELVPMTHLDEESGKWNTDEPVILYCRSGGRSDRAAVDLEGKGFRRVASMKGGILRWAALGLPIVGGEQG